MWYVLDTLLTFLCRSYGPYRPQLENESVVAEILSKKTDWTLREPPRFNSWKRRGEPSSGLSSENTRCLIRCSPDDNSNGFFVALFHRPMTDTPLLTSKCNISNCSDQEPRGPHVGELYKTKVLKRKIPPMFQWRHLSKRMKY